MLRRVTEGTVNPQMQVHLVLLYHELQATFEDHSIRPYHIKSLLLAPKIVTSKPLRCVRCSAVDMPDNHQRHDNN